MGRARRGDDYAKRIQRLFPCEGLTACRNITLQITGDCNLRCSYCYEHHKSCEAMSLETGKKIVDRILDLYEENSGDFINHHTKGVILDLIGGEPLLEARRIEEICDYWFHECWRRSIPLSALTRIAFATNGQLWFSADVQRLFQKYHELMSVTVSIDGVKELHDLHRKTPGGMGSFDKAWAAFQDGKKYGWYNSKMTFVPESFRYLFASVRKMAEEGCRDILCNYAFEPRYTREDARVLYSELKRLAEYLIREKPEVWVSTLSETIGEEAPNDHNWCGGTGAMIAFAPDGKAYPCIRYAPISVGEEKAASMVLGDAEHGLYATEGQRAKKAELDAITRTSQSPAECLRCPVASGCGWCSGYNYECFGTPNRRATNICLAHKARVLAVCYYLNRRSLVRGDVEPKRINLPRKEAEELIGKEQAEEVFELEKNALAKDGKLCSTVENG